MNSTRHVFVPRQYEERTSEIFPSAILTLVSIIQGVALYFLIDKTLGLVKDETSIAFVPYAMLSMANIIVVAFEYIWFVGLFTGLVHIFDVVGIFLIGFAEITSMYYMASPMHWWMWNAIFFFLAAIGFTNSLSKANGIDFKSQKVEKSLRTTLTRNRFIALVASFACACTSWAFLKTWHASQTAFVAGWLIAALFVFLLIKDHYSLQEIRDLCVEQDVSPTEKRD